MSDIELLRRGREGDKEAFEKFYKDNQGLVFSLLKRFNIPRYEYEELVQEANYGLFLAMKRFDFNLCTNFSTYAVPLILGEIKKHFRNGGMIKVSRSLKELAYKINKEVASLDISPSIDYLCKKFNESEENVIEALTLQTTIGSLDDEEYNDSSSTLLEHIDGNEGLSIIDLTSLQMGLEKLSKKERLIIELHYYGGLSQEEIAKRLNMNQVGVSRIEASILKKLKEVI